MSRSYERGAKPAADGRTGRHGGGRMKKETTQADTFRRWGLKLLLVLFDIFAVNFSYYMALVLRFYVNHEFHLAGTLFMPLFLKFAPYYTVCCIVVFWLFKLYNGMWRYAGFNDVNRVIWANLVTCAIQVFGTLLFIRRMPITYYALGAAIQFALVFLSRFSYRLFAIEFSKYTQGKNAAVNVMIIGAGETARLLLRQLESDVHSALHPVCVLDTRNREAGRLFNGLPVIGGLEQLEEAAGKYGVKSVILADSVMPQETRADILARCADVGLAVQDFSLYSSGGANPVRSLLSYVNGPLKIRLDGRTQTFENGEQALAALPGKYTVRAVSAEAGSVLIELERDTAAPNSADEAWARDYKKATGEDVSFF